MIMHKNPPPKTRKTDFSETLHGVEVSDPYRWLEDNSDQEVKQWVAEQNTHTREYLEKIPARGYLKERFTKLLYTPSFGVPVHKKQS